MIGGDVNLLDISGIDISPKELEKFKSEWNARVDLKPTVRFVRTHALAKLPTRGTDGAVGWDLYAVEEQHINPGERALISTGWNVAVPDGFEAQVRSRSGLALKNGVFVLNSPGTIDPDYRGSLGVILFNSDHDFGYIVHPGARVAQLVVAPVTQAAMLEVAAFEDETARGARGYGSTGH